MIRLTLRQFRTQGLVALGGLVAAAVVMALTGPHLAEVYRDTVANCARVGNCDTAINAFINTDQSLRMWLGVLVVAVPGIIGIFWGAPLVARELEGGTFRLVWTQSVTRSRWLAAKVGVIGLASMIVSGLLALMLTWWAQPYDRATMAPFATFDQRDLVPMAHAAFAFMVGVTVGVLIRRTLPAMATTAVVFVATRLAFVSWVRPHLIGPLQRIVPLDVDRMGFGSRDGGPMTLMPDTPPMPHAWIYSTDIADAAGHPISSTAVADACPNIAVPKPPIGGQARGPAPEKVVDELHACVTKLSARYHEVITYQPGSRYWHFQWIEVGIFLGGALLLAGLSWWWVRRRLR